MANDEQPEKKEDGNRKQIRLERIHLKDVSLETPNTPKIFTVDWDPSLAVDIENHYTFLSDDRYEIVLTVTATATIADSTAFLIEINQAGIFLLKGYNEQQLDRLCNVYCLKQLYPYACSTICELIAKGGFPQLLLAHLNFQQLYEKRLKDSAADADNPESSDNETANEV